MPPFIGSNYIRKKGLVSYDKGHNSTYTNLQKYIDNIKVFSINKQFIFIKWYENKYFTSGDSHHKMKINPYL